MPGVVLNKLARYGPLSFQSRNLDPFKDKLIEFHHEGTSYPDMRRYLEEKHDFVIQGQVIMYRLMRWGFPLKDGKLTNTLDVYRFDMLNWHRERESAKEIVVLLEENLKVHATEEKVKEHINIWTNPKPPRKKRSPLDQASLELEPEGSPWRGITICPTRNVLADLPSPANLLSEDELRSLEKAIENAYLADNTSTADPNLDWSERLVEAACFDDVTQKTIVKESKQPGHHWSNMRLFDPL
jgi:hypothetical protein